MVFDMVLHLTIKLVVYFMLASAGAGLGYLAAMPAVLVRIGNPTAFRIGGRVLDSKDRPVPGVRVFVDGTHPQLPFGYNRNDIQGKEALVAIDEKNYEIVTIPTEAAEKNMTTDRARIV